MSASDSTFTHVFTSQRPGKIDDYYKMEKGLVGEGSYGKVSKGQAKGDKANPVRAIKQIDLSKISDKARFDQEIVIQQSLDHPNIVKLYEVFKDARFMYLVMELCTGGELFDRIVEMTEKHDGQAFDENKAATYMQQILGAMRYLHSKNFVHRDIKPENFLMQNATVEAQIKIIDFGLAKRYVPGVSPPMTTKAGTPYYVAPQVLMGSYDEKCDVWSCGVIAYILLCGYPPFYGNKDPDILRAVKAGKFEYPSPDWNDISGTCKTFISLMLTMDPKRRPSFEELLEHPWLTKAEKILGKVTKDLAAKMKSFNSATKLKKVVLTLISQQLPDEEIEELSTMFKILDKNGDGTLTIKEVIDGVALQKIEVPKDFESILNSIDTDGSGAIDYSEFIASCMQEKQYLNELRMWEAFRKFDEDGDGVITKEELKKVLKESSDEALNAMINDADINGDGVISYDEFKLMLNKPSETSPKASPKA